MAASETDRAILQAIFDGTNDLVFAKTTDGMFLHVNSGIEQMFGCPKEDIIGKTDHDFMPKEIADNFRENDNQMLEQDSFRRNEEWTVFPDGRRVLLDTLKFPFRSETGDVLGIMGISRDITEINATRERLVQTEKLASLGNLVAGVAHEINTPLGIILTAASSLRAQSQDFNRQVETEEISKSDALEYADMAVEACKLMEAHCRRVADLIRSFKQVSADQTSGNIRKISLADYLYDVLRSLQPQISKTPHKVHVDCSEQIELETDPGGLAQIATNLIMNSLIHGFADREQPGNITFTCARQKGSVDILYTDDGCGMTEDVRHRVFDPFFTTKRGKGGSGLGMHICHNIVTHKLGGKIEAHPVDKGVRIEVKLPQNAPETEVRA